jgi:glutamate dehydrogenase (NAD(P)+)
MAQAFTGVLKTREKYNTDFRNAAFIVAVTKIAQSMNDRGI